MGRKLSLHQVVKRVVKLCEPLGKLRLSPSLLVILGLLECSIWKN